MPELGAPKTVADEISFLRTLKYFQLCDYLQKKYGIPCGDYFSCPTCKTPNPKIKRTSEGLFVHHIYECEFPDLSKTEMALLKPYDFQKAKSLVYCNFFEHLLLHIDIVLEFMTKEWVGVYPYPSSPGLVIVGLGGIVNYIIPQIVDYINGYHYEKKYLADALRIIDGNEALFVEIVKDFERELGESAHGYKKRAIPFVRRERFGSENLFRGIMTSGGKVDDLIFEYEIMHGEINPPTKENILLELQSTIVDEATIISAPRLVKREYSFQFFQKEKNGKLSFLLREKEFAKEIDSYIEARFEKFYYSLDKQSFVLVPIKSEIEFRKRKDSEKYYFVINGIELPNVLRSQNSANKIARRYNAQPR